MSRLLAALASLALTGLGFVLLLSPDCASACECIISPGGDLLAVAERAFSDSAAVFSGEVISVGEGSSSSGVILRVSEVWKGPERGTIEVTTASDDTACGYPFEEGREYLVYAGQRYKEEEGEIRPSDLRRVDNCGATKPLSKADADLEALGAGKKPTGGEVLSDTSWGVSAGAVVGMAGLALAASLLVVARLVRTG